MNFQDLLTKMKQLDECGEMSPMPPRQQDNVNMNVTMSGNGAGGIKDLLNILKNIEQGSDEPTGGDAVIIGSDDIADVEKDLDDSYNNEPNPEVAGIDAVTPTGNDLASKGDEAEKVNGGGNPWKQTEVSESLSRKLFAHYSEIALGEGTDPATQQQMVKINQQVLNGSMTLDQAVAALQQLKAAPKAAPQAAQPAQQSLGQRIGGAIGGAIGSAVQGVKDLGTGAQSGYAQATHQAAPQAAQPAGRPGSPSANVAARQAARRAPVNVSGMRDDDW